MTLLKTSEQFASEIEPAFAECSADPFSVRRANNLARALEHHVDWTYEDYSREDP